jgi:uncharacterized protein
MRKVLMAALLPAMVLAAPVVQAQFSASYNFLKAVRDRDGTKATEFLSKPGSVIVDTRDLSKGETALHIVTRERDTNWMNFLLARGARTDIKDNEGSTALMIATQLRFVEGIQTLIKYKASVDLANAGGETALIRAVQIRDPNVVRILLLAGANPDKRDTLAGLSARDYAKRDTRGVAILKLIEETKAKAAAPVAGPKL